MRSKRNRVAIASIFAVVWVTSLQCAKADSILFQHPATAPGGYASQSNVNYLAADHFTLQTDARVDGVRWGGSFSSEPPGNITQFVVTFWSNDNGLPGSVLMTETFAGDAGQTFVGYGVNGYLEYDYSVILSNPFMVQKGVPYWISVQTTTDFPPQPQWYWRSGPNSGLSAQSGSGGLTFQRVRGGDAFTLIGTTFTSTAGQPLRDYDLPLPPPHATEISECRYCRVSDQARFISTNPRRSLQQGAYRPALLPSAKLEGPRGSHHLLQLWQEEAEGCRNLAITHIDASSHLLPKK